MKNKENNTILKIVGEGGSIKLLKVNDEYYFTTDESTLMDFLDGELEEHEFKSDTGPFESFEIAFKSLMARYPIFKLYPRNICPEYISRILVHFNMYLETDKDANSTYSIDEWKEILQIK